jgi:phosphatidylglycerol:prolipoprotein diacylglycerol transferase
MYLMAFSVVYFLLRYRIGHDALNGKFSIFNFQFSIVEFRNLILDFLLLAMIGAIIGGRLGYVFLYNFSYFWHNPLAVISPYDLISHKFMGIYGMSYHGGLLGVILATWIFTSKNKINFWQWTDFVVPAIPAGYFFGRLGNFLNLELYGRVTTSWLGMHFPTAVDAGQFLRYPSQLLEAFLEGALLFVILWSMRNRQKFTGFSLAIYLVGYGMARIVGEFFREPDTQVGFIFSYFTLGQVFSAIMILAGIAIYFRRSTLGGIMK